MMDETAWTALPDAQGNESKESTPRCSSPILSTKGLTGVELLMKFLRHEENEIPDHGH